MTRTPIVGEYIRWGKCLTLVTSVNAQYHTFYGTVVEDKSEPIIRKRAGDSILLYWDPPNVRPADPLEIAARKSA